MHSLILYCLVKFIEIICGTSTLVYRTSFHEMLSALKKILKAACSFHLPPRPSQLRPLLASVQKSLGKISHLRYSQPPPLTAPTFLLCHRCCVGRQLVCGLQSPSMEWVSKASCVSSTSFWNPPQTSHQPKIKQLYLILSTHTSFRQTNDLGLLVSLY